MKFEKRLRAEIVPEWKTKYIDYKGLKKRLRTIQQAKVAREKELARESNYNSRARSPDLESLPNNNKRHSSQSFQSQQRTFSMTSMASSFFHKLSSALISIQKQQNLHAPPSQIKSLDTLMEQVDPEERLFFVALDKELAKIETFCELKEKEASNRMNLLIQQHEILKEEKERRPAKSRRNTRIFVRQSFEYIKTSSTVNCEKPEPEKQPMDYETAKKIIKKAVFEFYRGVELLKNYCVLNYIGFVKLLKKYDKVSERNGYKIYMQKVTKCYNVKSSQIKNLLKEAEDFYVNHFESGSRSRAIRKLRLPNKEHKTYYSSVLRVGLCLGLALPIAIYSLGYAWNKRTDGELLIYSGLVLPILLFLLLGINMYTWTRSHINYKFIFELDPRDNLDFRQYLELPAISLLALSFTIYFNYIYNISGILQRVYPILFTVFICAVVFNPFPILYYNARRWFVFSMARLLGSGILRVEFRDFFIADGLTSLSYSLIMFQLFGQDGRDIYIGRDIAHGYDTSLSLFTPFLGSIPAFLRLLQCLKRYRDTYQVHHLINLFKYLSIILAIFMASLYNKAKNDTVMLFLWLFTQSFASLYTFSWDVKMDWSLFKMHSINYLLRDELGFEHRWLYYGAIVSNFILRWSWVFTVIFPHRPLVGFFVASGEMFRRWQWNFFRVENEHINNCEQNRAVKEIPLPYRTEEDVIMPEEFETGSVDVESDFDRTSSFTSWRRNLFTANKSKLSTADNLRDFEPRKAPEYIYENIYEESDDDSDGMDDYDEIYGTNRRSKTISIIRAEGTHGLSNAYASRSFLPIIE